MPIIPGDPHPSMEPDRLWRLFERGALTESEIVLAFLDYLGDDVEPVVPALPAGFREVVERFLRSKPIDEIREGIHFGPGLPAEDRVRWRQYRQRKAAAVACHLGIRSQAADA